MQNKLLPILSSEDVLSFLTQHLSGSDYMELGQEFDGRRRLPYPTYLMFELVEAGRVIMVYDKRGGARSRNFRYRISAGEWLRRLKPASAG